MVAVQPGSGAHTAWVGAGIRLRNGEGGDLLATSQHREILALLPFIAEHGDGVTTTSGVDQEGTPGGRTAARHLGQNHGGGYQSLAHSSVFFRDLHPPYTHPRPL